MPYKISLNTLIIIGFKRIPSSITGKEYHAKRIFLFGGKKKKKKTLQKSTKEGELLVVLV